VPSDSTLPVRDQLTRKRLEKTLVLFARIRKGSGAVRGLNLAEITLGKRKKAACRFRGFVQFATPGHIRIINLEGAGVGEDQEKNKNNH